MVIGPGEDVLYAATASGTLHALDPADGHVLWTVALGAAASGDPALADGRLYVPLASGEVAVASAEGCGAPTGGACPVLWRADVGGPATQPAVAGTGADAVVVVATTGAAPHVVALAAAGCGASSCPTLAEVPLAAPVVGGPAIARGRVVVALTDGHLVGLAPA